MTSILKLGVVAACAVMFLTGCAGTLGTTGLNVSGQVATGGKVVDAGVTVGANTVTISGLFGQGSNTYSGTVTVPINGSTIAPTATVTM